MYCLCTPYLVRNQLASLQASVRSVSPVALVLFWTGFCSYDSARLCTYNWPGRLLILSCIILNFALTNSVGSWSSSQILETIWNRSFLTPGHYFITSEGMPSGPAALWFGILLIAASNSLRVRPAFGERCLGMYVSHLSVFLHVCCLIWACYLETLVTSPPFHL